MADTVAAGHFKDFCDANNLSASNAASDAEVAAAWPNFEKSREGGELLDVT